LRSNTQVDVELFPYVDKKHNDLNDN